MRWKYVGDVHGWLYEKSEGRFGKRLAGLDMVLLTTTGRKSGRKWRLPLAAYSDRGEWVVVASNGGQSTHPAWYLNLVANPMVDVRAGRDRYAGRADLADAAECERLWPLLVGYNSLWGGYREKTDRQIPIVILRRAG